MVNFHCTIFPAQLVTLCCMAFLFVLAYQLVNPIFLQTFPNFFERLLDYVLHCFKSVNHNSDPLICFLRQSVPFTELVKITKKIGEK